MTANQRRLNCWRINIPESSDSEPEQPRQDTTTSGEEQFESAESGSPPASLPVTGTSTPASTTGRYQQITGPSPAYPFSRQGTPRQTPPISRTQSITTQP